MQTIKFTIEQVERIKNKDMTACKDFYFDNYKIFYAMAVKFCNNKKSIGDYNYEVEDLMTQLYVDIPYLNYKSKVYFDFSVRESFKLSLLGGLWRKYNERSNIGQGHLFQHSFMSVDTPIISDSELLKIDLLVSAPSCEDTYIDNHNKSINIYNLVKSWLSDKQAKFLALVCFGYTQAEACIKLNVKGLTLSACIKKLKPYYAEVVDKMAMLNAEVVRPFIGVSPSQIKKKSYKSTLEEREKRRILAKNWREKQKHKKLA